MADYRTGAGDLQDAPRVFCSARKYKSAHKQTNPTWWGYVKETQPTERAPSGWKLEQLEQQNKWFCTELQLQHKINIHEAVEVSGKIKISEEINRWGLISCRRIPNDLCRYWF